MQNTKQNETRTPSIREQVLNPVDSSQILETGYLPSINQKKANSEKTLGNTFQRALDTIEDTGISGIKGFGKFFEGFVDFITGAASGIGTMFGADMSELDDFTKRDLTSELLDNEIFMHILRAPDVIGYINDNWTKSDVESNSYISEMGQRGQNISRGVSEAVGQIWAQILLAKLTGGIGNAMSTTGQISAGAQQAINLAALGTSVTGSSVEESLNNDEKIGRALLYGVVSGATEAGIEMISGGVQNKLMGVTKTAVNMEKVMGNVAKNRTARLALTLLGDAAGEGVEEMISEIVDPIEKKLILEHKENVDQATLESVLTAGLIGALSSFVAGGASTLVNYKSAKASQVMEDMEKARQKYAESNFAEEDTKAYNDAISGYKGELESILNSMKPENRKNFAFDVDNKTGVLKARNSAFEGYDYENNAFNEEAWNKSNEVKTFKDSTTVKMSEERAEQVKGLRSFFDRANKQARGLSANIEIVDTLGKDADGNLNNAAYDDKTNTIKIAADADPKKTFNALIVHELTHSTYKTQFMNLLKAFYTEEDVNKVKESIRELYEGASEELLEEEAYAHILEEDLGTQEFVDKLYEEKPSLFKRIYNKIKSWLKGDFKTKAEKEYEKDLKAIANLFENAINEKNTIGYDANGVRYSISKDNVIKIDLTTDLQKQYDSLKSIEEKQDFVFKYLTNQLTGQEVVLKDGMKFTNYRYDTHHLINQYDDLKYKTFLQLSDILNNAEYFSERAETNHKRYDYFKFYKVSVDIDGKRIDGILNIGKINNTKNDYRFYDLHPFEGELKKEPAELSNASMERKLAKQTDSSSASIKPQNEGDVKNKDIKHSKTAAEDVDYNTLTKEEKIAYLKKQKQYFKDLYFKAFTQNVILDMKKEFLKIQNQGLEISNKAQAKEIFELKKKQNATEQELVEALYDADLLSLDLKAMVDLSKRANKLNSTITNFKDKFGNKSFNLNNVRGGAEIDLMVKAIKGLQRSGWIANPTKTKEAIADFLKIYTPDNQFFKDYYKEEFANILQSYVNGDYDRVNYGRIINGIKVNGNKIITLKQVQILSSLMEVANTIINSQTQIIKDGKAVEMKAFIKSNGYDEQVTNKYDNDKNPNAIGRIVGKYGEAVSKADNVALEIDGTLPNETGFVKSLLKEIHDGKVNAVNYYNQLKDKLVAFNAKHKNYIRNLRKKSRTTYFEIIDSEGKTHKVSKGQAIYYYMLNMREQGKKHINVDYNPTAKGIKSYDKNGYEINKPYTLNDATFEDIESKLTAIDKEFIDVAKEVFKLGGEMKQTTDGLRMGYTNAIEKNYVPIVNDIFNRNVRLGKVESKTIENLFNLAFNMDTVKNANSYISNANILEVLNKYIRQVSNYAGGMIAVENVNKLLNYRVNDMSMLEMINAKHPNFKSWFNKYISDVFQVNMPDRTSALFSELRKAYSRAALGLNIKVWMTQFTSYPLAFTQLKASSLLYGLKGFRKVFNYKGRNNFIGEFKQYAPATFYRTVENTILLAESNTTETIANDATRVLDYTTLPISQNDAATIYALWEACQKDVETRLDLKIGTEENKIEAGKLLDSVVAETQPNFDAENSPAIRRSQNEIIRTLMMFKTQPFQMLNVLIGTVNNMVNLKKRLAWFEGKAEGAVDPYGKTKAQVEEMAKTVKVRAVKSGTAVFTATLSYALVAALFARLLGRVDDKDELENVRDQFIASFISMFPITNALYQMLYEGYSLSSSPIEYIDSLFSNMKKVIDNPSKNNVWAFVKSFSQMTGVPLKNLTDYIGGILNLFDPAKAYKYKNLFYTQPATTDKKIIDAAIETNRDKLGEVSLENYLSKKGIRDLNNSYYSSVYGLIKQDSDRLSKLSTSPLTTGDEIKYADDSTYQATRQDVSSYNIRASASLNSLINSSYYKKLSDDDKVKANKKVATTVKAVTTLKYGKVSKNKLANATKYFGFKEEELVSFYYYLRSLKSEGKEKVLATINKSKYNTYQKLVLKDLLGYKLSDIEQNSVSNHVASLSKSTKELLFKNL